MKHIGFIFTIIILFISCEKEKISATDYLPNTNLFLPDENGDSTGVADPCVIKVEDTWYIYGASKNKIHTWSSKDLYMWKYEGIVWEPSAWNVSAMAPHVQIAPEGFYLYYSSVKGFIGVAFSTIPTGKFEEIYNHPFIGHGYGGVGDGQFNVPNSYGTLLGYITDAEEYTIDPYVLKANDGSLTFYSSAYNPLAVIIATPMIDYKTLASGKPSIVLYPNLLSWESYGREGPWVVENKNSYYLMYSAPNFESDSYAVGVAKGKTPMGPFNRQADNPILKSDNTKNIYGPGHNCVVTGKKDDLLIFYHTRNQKGGGTDQTNPRFTRYMPLYFDAAGNMKVKQN